MKITGRKSQPGSMNPMTGPVANDAAPDQEAVSQEPVADQVDVASSTQVRKLAQLVQAMPDSRPEKVEELRLQIDEGSYFVESQKLARKVVDEALSELLSAERGAL